VERGRHRRIGVLALVVGHGAFPWISLTLALSFGSYGILRKKAGHAAMLGLCVETMLMAPVALLFLTRSRRAAPAHWARRTEHTDLLLLAAGLITVAPCCCFWRPPNVVAPVHRRPDPIYDAHPAIPAGGRVYREPFTAFIWFRLHLAGAGAVQHRRLVQPSPEADGAAACRPTAGGTAMKPFTAKSSSAHPRVLLLIIALFTGADLSDNPTFIIGLLAAGRAVRRSAPLGEPAAANDFAA
jgi:hypothetical protein